MDLIDEYISSHDIFWAKRVDCISEIVICRGEKGVYLSLLSGIQMHKFTYLLTQSKTSTPYRLKSAEKYLNNTSSRSVVTDHDKSDYDTRYSRSSSPLFLREQMKAEAQIRAERDADLKHLRRSVSPKRPKSPGSKSSPRSRSTSPIPLRYSTYTPATPYEEYKSAITSLRNLRDNPSYMRSPPGKERTEESNPSTDRIISGATLDSGIGVARYGAAQEVETTLNYSNKSPLANPRVPCAAVAKIACKCPCPLGHSPRHTCLSALSLSLSPNQCWEVLNTHTHTLSTLLLSPWPMIIKHCDVLLGYAGQVADSDVIIVRLSELIALARSSFVEENKVSSVYFTFDNDERVDCLRSKCSEF
eukprot:sb/3466035/